MPVTNTRREVTLYRRVDILVGMTSTSDEGSIIGETCRLFYDITEVEYNYHTQIVEVPTWQVG